MAAYNWGTYEIDLSSDQGVRSFTLAELSLVPNNTSVSISLVHEYMHYVQATSSLTAMNVLGELISFGVHGALHLSGALNSGGNTVSGYHDIVGILRKQKPSAGRDVPELTDRAHEILQEVNVAFGNDSYAYNGACSAWSLDRCRVPCGSDHIDMWGIVTPSGRIRPITPVLLAEGMARRIDRWFAVNMGIKGHSWMPGTLEDEHYNGLWNVLGQQRYSRNVHESTRAQITVIVCHLALACTSPDKAVRAMLERLACAQTAGLLPAAVGQELKAILVRQGILKATSYNEKLAHFQDGPAKLIERKQYYPVFQQLQLLSQGVSDVLSDPCYLADDTVTWNKIETLMRRYTLPPVKCSDGLASQVAGITATDSVSGFMREIWRVLF